MIKELKRNLIILKFNRVWVESEDVFKIGTFALRFICIVSMTISSLGMIIEVYYSKGDIVIITYCVFLVGCTIPTFAKFYCLMKYRPVLKNILKKLESELVSKYQVDEKEKEYITDAEKQIRKHFWKYWRICMTGCSLTILIPLWKKLLILLELAPDTPIGIVAPSWTPFEINDLYRYALVCVFQAYHLYSITAVWVGLDTVIGGIVFHFGGHFSIISERITAWASSKQRKDLGRIISYHADVLRLADNLNESVNFAHLWELVCMAIISCCCGVQIINAPKEEPTRAIVMFFLLSCVMGSWLVVCILGTKLVTDCEKVSQSVYFSEWINLSGKEREKILFILSRSQKPVYLTCGKFFHISLTTFLDTVKMSYSLLAILREVYA